MFFFHLHMCFFFVYICVFFSSTYVFFFCLLGIFNSLDYTVSRDSWPTVFGDPIDVFRPGTPLVWVDRGWPGHSWPGHPLFGGRWLLTRPTVGQITPTW